MASIPDRNPNPADTINNQGAVPHRLSAHHPRRGGKAICKPIFDIRVAQYMPTAIDERRSLRGAGTLSPNLAGNDTADANVCLIDSGRREACHIPQTSRTRVRKLTKGGEFSGV